ncbi:hypothetical protein Q5M85_08755 [Paraclostridium bifermentans]|nr:hypothetical protein [Paraclostridium bifermentans]
MKKNKNDLMEVNFLLDKIKIHFKSNNIFINVLFIVALVLIIYLANDEIVSWSILIYSISNLLFGIGYLIKSVKS